MKRIKKGDRVRVTKGKNFGSEGIVLKVLNKKNAAIIEEINKVKVHKKADNENSKGGIVEQEAPISLSNLTLIDNKNKNSSTKVKYIIQNDKKIKVARKTGNVLGGNK